MTGKGERMKVQLDIDSQVLEDLVTIEARQYSPQISQLVDYIHKLDKVSDRLTVKRREEVHLLAAQDIYRLVIEDRQVHVKTQAEEFTSNLRLYQVKDLLPASFLQISQSEIVNLDHLDHLQVTPNGLVKIIMKNGDFTYSSRRYLKTIKETLGL